MRNFFSKIEFHFKSTKNMKHNCVKKPKSLSRNKPMWYTTHSINILQIELTILLLTLSVNYDCCKSFILIQIMHFNLNYQIHVSNHVIFLANIFFEALYRVGNIIIVGYSCQEIKCSILYAYIWSVCHYYQRGGNRVFGKSED